MEGRTGAGMQVFQHELVMIDVEASTALWDWNSHFVNMALQLHHQTLRTLLPCFFAYQVRGCPVWVNITSCLEGAAPQSFTGCIIDGVRSGTSKKDMVSGSLVLQVET